MTTVSLTEGFTQKHATSARVTKLLPQADFNLTCLRSHVQPGLNLCVAGTTECWNVSAKIRKHRRLCSSCQSSDSELIAAVPVFHLCSLLLIFATSHLASIAPGFFWPFFLIPLLLFPCRKCPLCSWQRLWWETKWVCWTGWDSPCACAESRCTSGSKRTTPNVSGGFFASGKGGTAVSEPGVHLLVDERARRWS